MSNGNAVRPNIKNITITFEDGSQKVYPHDGYMPTALFWGEKGIDILGAYYDHVKKNQTVTYEQLEADFGKATADAVTKPGKTAPLNRAVIKKIWETPTDTDADAESTPVLPGLLSKEPACPTRS